ncbi:ABC transporter substrate-binding protein [Vibrio zhanjiangensis]|uniref:ABC transporter substrate-binding protein n=1 Tax=Vibrio zhanjiangensis TaxID=1046128 RepID=A0ABQ6F041_9VIBR|nr:ABC transporter substrate-binding protein [Vibrio zhanjiangensis]GLT18311.1 ABC transporter substrate-binding protein [Vibrio zhanjiangensis]
MAALLCVIAFIAATLSFSQHIWHKDSPIPEIRVGVSLTPLASPFLVAEHLGLFEEHGLNVVLFPCASGTACTQLMLSRDVEYATASESVVMYQSFNQSDLALLVSFVESDNDLKLLTLTPTGISEVGQLEDKRVGVVKGSASEFYFDSVLVANNYKALNVEKVYLQPHELVPALLSFSVDAISAWEPMGYKADIQSASTVRNLGTPGIYQHSFNLLSTAPYLEFAGQEPVHLLNALDEAVDWINAHPDEASRLIAKRLNIPLNQVKWSWEDYVFRLSLGNSLLSNLQLQARWALKEGLVKNQQPDFRELFYEQPFQQITALRD